jgi:hypothetical protein
LQLTRNGEAGHKPSAGGVLPRCARRHVSAKKRSSRDAATFFTPVTGFGGSGPETATRLETAPSALGDIGEEEMNVVRELLRTQPGPGPDDGLLVVELLKRTSLHELEETEYAQEARAGRGDAPGDDRTHFVRAPFALRDAQTHLPDALCRRRKVARGCPRATYFAMPRASAGE